MVCLGALKSFRRATVSVFLVMPPPTPSTVLALTGFPQTPEGGRKDR